MGVVTARGYQKGPVLTVPACDTEPPNSGALGSVYILGTSCMPVPSGYWHTCNLASDYLGKLWGTSVSPLCHSLVVLSADHASLNSSHFFDQTLRILLKPEISPLGLLISRLLLQV